jgi:hypothetical protein
MEEKPMSSTKKVRVVVAIVALALAGVLVSACSLDRRVAVESGEYAVLRGEVAGVTLAGSGIQSLVVDRDQNLVVLALADGSEVVRPFVARDRRDWPAGCPTNINTTRMEVLDLIGPLTLGTATLSRPVLVRDCPRDPVRVVLREDGAIGGAGTACPYPEPCIHFRD